MWEEWRWLGGAEGGERVEEVAAGGEEGMADMMRVLV